MDMSLPDAGLRSPLFEASLQVVLAWEGGETVTDDPLDPGGITRWGISLAFLRRIDPGAGPDRIRALDRDEAAAIYARNFWRPIRGDQLPPPLALFTFDSAVNLGVPRAVRLLQQAVGADVDGIMGPRTVNAARAAAQRPQRLTQALADMAAGRLQIYATRPGFPRFGRGWTRRVLDVHGRAVALATAEGAAA